jgi:hypothetical protein
MALPLLIQQIVICTSPSVIYLKLITSVYDVHEVYTDARSENVVQNDPRAVTKMLRISERHK